MSRCEHVVVDNCIHQFVFKEANRSAIDEYAVILEEVMANLDADEPWLTIVDMSESGMIPLRYALKKIGEISGKYLEDRTNRTVILNDAGPVAQIGQALVNPINNNVRFLTPDKFEQGVEWLKQVLVR